MAVSYTWLGHSAFTFNIGNKTILIDPFLTNNPLAAVSADELNPDVILLSHAHGDHLGDTVDIAKRTGVPVVANFEIGQWLGNQDIDNAVSVNPGGTYDLGFAQVKWTIAHHSSSFPDGTYGGQPNGIIIKVPDENTNVYFAGDTALFLEMQLIGDEGIDLAVLPIGDHFTMGIDDSIKAIKMIRPRYVAPMHYNTFPPIAQDAGSWGNRVSSETEAQPIVIDPGNSYTIE